MYFTTPNYAIQPKIIQLTLIVTTISTGTSKLCTSFIFAFPFIDIECFSNCNQSELQFIKNSKYVILKSQFFPSLSSINLP